MADVCFGMCPHDREPIAGRVTSGPRGGSAVDATPSAGASHPSCGPDDCFCCSHYVDVRLRVQFTPARSFVPALVPEALSRRQLTVTRLYHPPLA
jgi:hypothetical protein